MEAWAGLDLDCRVSRPWGCSCSCQTVEINRGMKNCVVWEDQMILEKRLLLRPPSLFYADRVQKAQSLVICSYFLKKSVVKSQAKWIYSEQHSISMSDYTSMEGHRLSLGSVLLISQSRCLISAVSWMLGNHTQNTPQQPPRLCNKSRPPRQQEETIYVQLGEDFRSLWRIVMHLCSSVSLNSMWRFHGDDAVRQFSDSACSRVTTPVGRRGEF